MPKITINNIRPEKGGNPSKYRTALSSDAHLVDEALSHDTQRRNVQTALEQLRHQTSDLQMNVIAPKKKAGEDVPLGTIGQLKQWKVDIATLIGEVKEWEQKRNEALARIDEL